MKFLKVNDGFGDYKYRILDLSQPSGLTEYILVAVYMEDYPDSGIEFFPVYEMETEKASARFRMYGAVDKDWDLFESRCSETLTDICLMQAREEGKL